jgi:hypothetical protein
MKLRRRCGAMATGAAEATPITKAVQVHRKEWTH